MVTVNERHYERRRTAAQLAAENPTLDAELCFESDTDHFKRGPGAWNTLPYADATSLPELAAADPAELDVDTVGATTTLTLTDRMARWFYNHRTGQYYLNANGEVWGGGQALSANNLFLTPVPLSAGTLDRVGTEVVTPQAGTTLRVGVYTDNDGLPDALVAEATPGVATGAGVQDLTISAVIPVNGMYWIGVVIQGSSTATVRNFTRGQFFHLPYGTTAPTGTTNYLSRLAASVTGALPSTVTVSATPNTAGPKIHFRYA